VDFPSTDEIIIVDAPPEEEEVTSPAETPATMGEPEITKPVINNFKIKGKRRMRR